MRKILLGSILAITSIASISFADYIDYNNVYEFDVGERTQVGNYIYGPDEYGNLATDNGTIAGNLFYSLTNAYRVDFINAYGWIDGQLYYYSKTSDGSIRQGFIQNFCSSSEGVITCVEGTYDLTLDDVKNSISTIQKVYYTVSYTSTSQINVLCFYDGNTYYCASANIYNGGGSQPTNSLGLDLNSFQDFVSYNWGPSPLIPTTPSGKPDTEGVCITVEQMFEQYTNNNYNTGLCYSSERYLTASGFVTTTPKFITDLYPTYTELRQSRNEYQNYCQPPATMETCQQAFTGREDEYTLISKIPQGTDLTVLYDMCNIYQTRSGDMQKNFCDMTEEERQQLRPSQMTPEGYAERIAKNPTTTTTPTSGTVYDELTDQTNRDILEAIPRVYTKITGIFKKRGGYDGIIPNYITRLILVIVLFKLFKK